MKKLEQEKLDARNRRLRLATAFVSITVLLLGALQIVVSNRLANLGAKIEEENAKIDLLTAENRLLEEELRQKESLANISQKAKELGFVDAKSIYYLVPQVPVAMK